MTYFDLYELDETFTLYVVWNGRTCARASGRRRLSLLRTCGPDRSGALRGGRRHPPLASAQRGWSSTRPLIRAVNALQALGKEKALKALWAYVRCRELGRGRFKYQVDEYPRASRGAGCSSTVRLRAGARDIARPEGEGRGRCSRSSSSRTSRSCW
jgi:hypothetical protein